MDRQDQRKRAFSQAFQLINQSRLSENYTQSAKRISTSPLNPVDLYHQEYDRKNETPLDLDCVPAFDEIPGTQIRHAAPAGLSYADPSVKSHNSLQYELYSYGPGPEVEADIEYGPSPVVRNERLGSETQYDSPLPTPAVVRGRSMFGPSPYVRPDSLPSITIVNSDFRNETTSVNPNSEDSPMSDATTAINPPTPSALNFSDLSLNSEGYSIPSSPLRISVHENRTTVSIVPASSFAECYPDITPNEVIIIFDKGKNIRKVDKYPLSNASRFFAQLLSGPFLNPGLTRRIRLRDDFPHAVAIMLHFLETGQYVFDQRAFERFPLLTTLDYHIHVYLVSEKYGIASLRDCVTATYPSIAGCELDLGFLVLGDAQAADAQVTAPGFPVFAPAETGVGTGTVITPIDRFLNSVVLLWRNTRSRDDALRGAVLELIKRDFLKLLRVPFFVTLVREMVGFGEDVVASLGDDGLGIDAVKIAVNAGCGHAVRFGM